MVIYSRRTNDAPVVSEGGGDVDLTEGYSGAVFTSPLTLPNNSRINGVEHFYQTTKPITRGDGSALGIGDRWWRIDHGTEWFWNGTYWVSTNESTLFARSPTFSGASPSVGSNYYDGCPTYHNILFSRIGSVYSTSLFNNINDSNFLTMALEVRNSIFNIWVNTSVTLEHKPVNLINPVVADGGGNASCHFARDIAVFRSGSFDSLRFTLTATGTPPNIASTTQSFVHYISFREVLL